MMSKRLKKAWTVERLHKAFIQIQHLGGSWRVLHDVKRFSRMYKEYSSHFSILEIDDLESAKR